MMLESVRELMVERVVGTPFYRVHPVCADFVAGGKLLRADLAIRLGQKLGRDGNFLVMLAAGVELIHAASLVHDDILDGADLRRGVPAMWKVMGIHQAILFGDLLFFLALELLGGCIQDGRIRLARIGQQICEGEYEQEILAPRQDLEWCDYLRMVQLKTGALFSFAASAVVPEGQVELQEALELAGYDLGVAYQIADDFVDAYGRVRDWGKSTRRDSRLGKFSAAALAKSSPVSPVEEAEKHLAAAEEGLSRWPEIHSTWAAYVDERIRPLIRDVVILQRRGQQ